MYWAKKVPMLQNKRGRVSNRFTFFMRFKKIHNLALWSSNWNDFWFHWLTHWHSVCEHVDDQDSRRYEENAAVEVKLLPFRNGVLGRHFLRKHLDVVGLKAFHEIGLLFLIGAHNKDLICHIQIFIISLNNEPTFFYKFKTNKDISFGPVFYLMALWYDKIAK